MAKCIWITPGNPHDLLRISHPFNRNGRNKSFTFPASVAERMVLAYCLPSCQVQCQFDIKGSLGSRRLAAAIESGLVSAVGLFLTKCFFGGTGSEVNGF